MKIVLINTYVLKECTCLFIAYFFVLTQKIYLNAFTNTLLKWI